jgi:ferredoxin-NADP reductase
MAEWKSFALFFSRSQDKNVEKGAHIMPKTRNGDEHLQREY